MAVCRGTPRQAHLSESVTLGASRSEPQTPLLISPPQLDLGQFSNTIYHRPDWTNKPHTSPQIGLGKNSESKEGVSGPHVDGVSPTMTSQVILEEGLGHKGITAEHIVRRVL